MKDIQRTELVKRWEEIGEATINVYSVKTHELVNSYTTQFFQGGYISPPETEKGTTLARRLLDGSSSEFYESVAHTTRFKRGK